MDRAGLADLSDRCSHALALQSLNGLSLALTVKIGPLELAKQLGNVSQACKMMGSSRDNGDEYGYNTCDYLMATTPCHSEIESWAQVSVGVCGRDSSNSQKIFVQTPYRY